MDILKQLEERLNKVQQEFAEINQRVVAFKAMAYDKIAEMENLTAQIRQMRAQTPAEINEPTKPTAPKAKKTRKGA
jgi:uncharacterized coiled-coil protein SlyX